MQAHAVNAKETESCGRVGANCPATAKERERETDRDRQRQRYRETETEIQRDRDRQREREKLGARERGSERERERERERGRDSGWGGGRERDSGREHLSSTISKRRAWMAELRSAQLANCSATAAETQISVNDREILTCGFKFVNDKESGNG
jgi:hypothetical protein